MADHRIHPLRVDHAADAYLGEEPPDLGPVRALAERSELAGAVAGLTDSYGDPLAPDDPLAPLARDIARALVETGFTLPRSPGIIGCTGWAGYACCRSPAGPAATTLAESSCPGRLMTYCRSTGTGGRSTTARTRS